VVTPLADVDLRFASAYTLYRKVKRGLFMTDLEKALADIDAIKN
jgi:hypothetical protein